MSGSESSAPEACPSEETLEAIAGGLVPTSGIAGHLETCSSCRATLEELKGAVSMLDSVIEAGLDPAASADGRVSGYRLLKEIHRGGQGVVWLAEQHGTSRRVAIKMLLLGVAATTEQRRRFEREVEVIASLRDPAIVTIFEQGVTADGVPYYAMEFVEGRRFDEWLEDTSPSITAAVRMLARIAEAVGTAHRRGVIHRDLKPGNILIDDDGLPRVLDFGLARLETEREFDASMTAETQDGAFLGNFAYASPEQLSGAPHAVDTSSDVYALGLLLYEALTRRRAFPNPDSIAALVEQRIGRTPPRPSTLTRGIGHELDLIVLRALDPDPKRRYATGGEFAADLRRYLDGRPVLARGDSASYVIWKAARRNVLATSIAVASLVIILSALVLLWQANVESRRRLVRAGSVASVYESAFAFINPQEQGTLELRAPELVLRLEETARTVLADEPADRARMLVLSGEALCNLEREEDAARCFSDALDIAEDLPPQDRDVLLAASHHGLGRVGYIKGKSADRRAEAAAELGMREDAARQSRLAVSLYDEAMAHYGRAIELRQSGSAASPKEHARSVMHLAGTRLARLIGGGRLADPRLLAEVEAEFVAAQHEIAGLKPADPEFEASAWNAIAVVRQEQGNAKAAIEAARRAAALVERDEASSWAGRAQGSLGTRLLRAGMYEEAIPPLQRGVEICREIFGDQSTITTRYWSRLVEALLLDGRFEDVLSVADEFQEMVGDDDVDVTLCRMDALVGLGRTEEAITLGRSRRGRFADGTEPRGLEIRRVLLGAQIGVVPTDDEREEIFTRWGRMTNEAAD